MSQAEAQVVILMGSANDHDTIVSCRKALDNLGISHEARFSRHTAPGPLMAYLETLPAKGTQVIVAAAGMAAHLAVLLLHTPSCQFSAFQSQPVHFPASTHFLSTVQMPGGVPVASMGIGSAGAKNAAYMAARIIGLNDEKVRARLVEVVKGDANKVLSAELPTEY